MRWVVLVLAGLLLPYAVYVLSKAATLGRLKATHEFNQWLLTNFVHQQEEKKDDSKEK